MNNNSVSNDTSVENIHVNQKKKISKFSSLTSFSELENDYSNIKGNFIPFLILRRPLNKNSIMELERGLHNVNFDHV